MPFSTASASSVSDDNSGSGKKYAVIDHSSAYEASMRGRHGRQLALAALEGIGKDDPPFDPFLEEELAEERMRLAAASVDEDEVLGLEEGGDAVEAAAEDEGGFEEEDDEDYFDDEDGGNDDQQQDIFRTVYNNDGSLRRTKSELATLKAGAPAGGMFAIVELAGSQFKVTTDDVLVVNRLKPVNAWPVGSTHTFKENVLLVGSSHLTCVGMPYVSGAEVDVMVEEVTKDAKVVVFKKRRRKNSKRKKGFRRDVTMLRVLDVRPPQEYVQHKHVERVQPAINDDGSNSTSVPTGL